MDGSYGSHSRPELIVAERDPACLAAPAGVDQALSIGKQGRERGAGVGRAIGRSFAVNTKVFRDGDPDQIGHLSAC